MKKNWKFIILLLITILILSSIVFILIKKDENELEKNKNIATTINNNSNLPVEYMKKKTRKDSDRYQKKYEFINNYMSDDYSNKDIEFSYYGYPNDESPFYLASITLLSRKYNLLGVKVGDKIEKSISKIEKYGFKVTKNNGSDVKFEYDDYIIYIKSDIINYTDDDNYIPRIEEISISAESAYLGNRIY